MDKKTDEKQPRQMSVHIVKSSESVRKAENPTNVSKNEAYNSCEWINHPVNLNYLEILVSNSSMLPQCIRAYKNNIAGFGIGVRYKSDIEETPEAAAEYERVSELLELMTLEQDTKGLFEDVIEARETYGIAYVEIIRNIEGEVNQIDFIKETASIYMTSPLLPYVEADFCYKDRIETRRKKFKKYRQQIGGQTVYFKEFGDPRIMDNRTGDYLPEGGTLELGYQANEILEFPIGVKPYGEVRWIGQILGIDGSRRAENLNNNYFINGRHTPLMIIMKNGTLTEESFTKLQTYMDDIKGENGQHAFIVLETENSENKLDYEGDDKADIEIKDLASILQKDELFQEYLDNNRRRIQSSFLLPDLYVGYTTDFNRATAQTAMEVTEKQVFQPERKSLAWIINNKLLNEYQLKYTEVYFKEPDITNVDDLTKVMNIVERAGGLVPNKAKAILYDMLGDTYEDFEGDWGTIPLAYSKTQSGANNSPATEGDIRALEMQIQKAEGNGDTDTAVVAVMKEVRSLLLKMADTERGE